MKTQFVAILVAVILPCEAAQAHHSFAAQYDPSELVTVAGRVTGFELVNPHAIIKLDVTDNDGETKSWRIEMPGRLSLARRGWTDDTLKAGDRLTAIGHPALTGEPQMWWQRMTLADGTEYLFPALSDQIAIEEQRRERARRARE